MKKVVIMESLGIDAAALQALEAGLADRAEFVSYPKTTDVPTLIAQARDADAMILANMPMPGEVIRACPQLRFIDVAFTGDDHKGHPYWEREERVLAELGARIVYFPYTASTSSTKLRQAISASQQSAPR